MERQAECRPCCCNAGHTADIYTPSARSVRIPDIARCDPTMQNYASDYQHDRSGRGHDPRPMSNETSEALAALREKTCNALRLELQAMTEACQPWASQPVPSAMPMQRGGAEVQRQADLIDYVPESEFLRRMKQQCEYLRSNQENIFSALDELGLNDYPVEYSRSGVNFVSGNQINVRKSPSENLGQVDYSQRSMRANETDLEYIHSGRKTADRYQGRKIQSPSRNGERKSEHISRSKKKTFSNRGTRKRTTSEKSQSRERFEPTLKRPHEDSCERCWRYASPARSPVNKPDQKFDPNFRKAHSTQDFEKGDGNVQFSAEAAPSFHAQSITSKERVKLASQRSESPQQRDEIRARSQVPSSGQRPESRQREDIAPRAQVGPPAQGPASRQRDDLAPRGQVGPPVQRPASRQDFAPRGQVGPLPQGSTPRPRDKLAPRGQVGSAARGSPPRQMDEYLARGQGGAPGQVPSSARQEEFRGRGQVGPPVQGPSSRQRDDLTPRGPVGPPVQRPASRQREDFAPRGQAGPAAQGMAFRQMDDYTARGQGGTPQQQQFSPMGHRPQTSYTDAQCIERDMLAPPQGSGRYPRIPSPKQQYADSPKKAASKAKTQELINELPPSRSAERNVARPQAADKSLSKGYQNVYSDSGRPPRPKSCTPGIGYGETYTSRVASENIPQDYRNTMRSPVGQPVCVPPGTDLRTRHDFPLTSFIDPGLFSARVCTPRPCDCCLYPRGAQQDFSSAPPCDYSSGGLSPGGYPPGGRSPTGRFPGGHSAGGYSSGGRSPSGRFPGGPAGGYADGYPAGGPSAGESSPGGRSPSGRSTSGRPPSAPGGLSSAALVQQRGASQSQTKAGSAKGSSKTSPTKAKRGAPQIESELDTTVYKDLEDSATAERRKKGKVRAPSPKQGGKGKQEGTKSSKTSPTTPTEKSGRKSPTKSSKSSKSPPKTRRNRDEDSPKTGKSSKSKGSTSKRSSKSPSKRPSKLSSKSPSKYTSQKSQSPPNEKKCDFETNERYMIPCPDMRDLICNQNYPGARVIPDQSKRPHPIRSCCCPVRSGKSCCTNQEPLDCILCCHCDGGPNQNQNLTDPGPATRVPENKRPAYRPNGRGPGYPDCASPGGNAPLRPENYNQSLRDLQEDCFIECPYLGTDPALEAQKNYVRQADQVNKRALRERQNFCQPPYNYDVNPKTYFVFYMTKSKQCKGEDDVEVLVEEVSQTCPGAKDTRTRDITEKMKKIMEGPSDSLALRFQKGVTESCKTPRSSRTLYF